MSETDQLSWNDDYSVGHPLMDSQHKNIIYLINECIALRAADQFDLSRYLHLLEQLNRYGELHLSDEERLLEEVGFEFLVSHKMSHESYRERLTDITDSEPTVRTVERLIKFLSFWWMHHIEIEDMQYKPFVYGATVRPQAIEWDDEKYDVGHSVMNLQHKRLIEILNEMLSQCASYGDDKSNLAYHYQRFYKLFDAHLESEEKLLEQSGYEFLKEHKVEHRNYLDEVDSFALEGLEHEETRKRLMRFLLQWWNEHILVHDMGYKEHFQSQAVDLEKTVLIVDDAPEMLTHLKQMVESAGYRTVTADSGESALNMLKSIDPDLILLDVSMPEIDGFEVCKLIKDNPQHKATPLIFVTSETGVEKRLKGADVGAVSYITKPVSTDHLLKNIEKHI